MTAQILRPTISKNKTPQLNSQVRSKFLMRIGVVGTDPNTFCKHRCETADGTTDSCIPTRDLQKVPRYSTQLKYNRNDERKRRCQQRSAAASADQNSSSSSSATSSSNKSKPKKRCTFNESVKVVPIPTRHEYSDRIRSRLWSNAIELYENAARNHVEFAAESYDWRNACDDEQMYLCRSTGEKIHPVHYEMLQDPLLDAHQDASPFKSPTAKTKYWYWESQDVI
mmetsp:Transcript_11618/g.17529  ORF Transcript_11618/g.17529 Transcript_11618/m.17529 type:complete len:225 (-) Transcript_11618:144-818(-)